MIANCFFKDSNLTENKAFSSATKRKFRKVVAFPPASDIFLSFDKKNNTVHMLNTMALKEQ